MSEKKDSWKVGGKDTEEVVDSREVGAVVPEEYKEDLNDWLKKISGGELAQFFRALAGVMKTTVEMIEPERMFQKSPAFAAHHRAHGQEVFEEMGSRADFPPDVVRAFQNDPLLNCAQALTEMEGLRWDWQEKIKECLALSEVEFKRYLTEVVDDYVANTLYAAGRMVKDFLSKLNGAEQLRFLAFLESHRIESAVISRHEELEEWVDFRVVQPPQSRDDFWMRAEMFEKLGEYIGARDSTPRVNRRVPSSGSLN